MSEPRGVEERLAWMRDHEPGEAGQCARWTWYALGGNQDPPSPPAWGTPDANAVVANMRAAGELHTDRNAPRGAIVLWTSENHGHMALSKGPEYNNDIHSTDPYGNWGKTGTMPQKWPEQNWGQTWAGWSDYYAGVRLPMGAEPEPEPEPSGPWWSDYSGKPSGTLTISNAQDYVSLDMVTADPPSSGLEFHMLYVNCELTWSGSDPAGIIRVKYRRADGDETAFQDYAVPKGAALGSPDTFLITATHWEAGEKGKGGRWYLRCEGGISSVRLGTRYAKIGVIS
jgi:hypothetical protein